MTISASYPNILQNGTPADATQVMANFYQIQNDVNTNAAHNGANSDITSIVGLTTPLSVAQGGIGASSFAAAGIAGLASPTFTGTPVAPTAAPGTNTTQLATTAFVAASYAPLASPALTGNPTAPTQAAGNNSTRLATTAFVATSFAPLASPALIGNPTAPTPVANDSDTSIATTAFANPANSQGANGYYKLPSGIIEQWGVSSSIAPGSSATVTFPIAFVSSCFNIIITRDGSNTNTQASDYVDNISATQFDLHNQNPSSSNAFFWRAVGV